MRGWESLDKDVHLIDTAEGLRRSHLKTGVDKSVFCLFFTCMNALKMHINVFVCVSHQLREQEDCYMEVKYYI